MLGGSYGASIARLLVLLKFRQVDAAASAGRCLPLGRQLALALVKPASPFQRRTRFNVAVDHLSKAALTKMLFVPRLSGIWTKPICL